MAKADLIGGTLWESYSNKVNDRMRNPRHLGEITGADAEKLGARLVVADWGAEVCGDAIRAFWAVDPRTNRDPLTPVSRHSGAAPQSPPAT